MEREEAIWLAGLLEGEGCFYAVKMHGKEYPAIKVVMVDKDVIERVARLFGRECLSSKGGFRSNPNPNHKPTHEVNISGWPAVDVMEAIIPWMGERRTEKIEELVGAYKARGAYRKGGDVCRRGHKFTPENTRVEPNGSRFCLTCAEEYPSNRGYRPPARRAA